jgi:peptidoglycan pentaglycine glycine transferase (the first glycine)
MDTVIIDQFDSPDEWDGFVWRNPEGHFFQGWGWGELQAGLGARTHRIAAVSQGRIVGCVQLFVFESGTRKFAYIPRGPVADPEDGPLVAALLQAVQRVSAREGAFLARIEPQWAASPGRAAGLTAQGFAVASQRIMPLRTVLVDLSPSPEEIWARFRSNTRNRIRLAEKRHVEVRVGGEADMAAFVRLFDETITRHGLRRSDTDACLLAGRIFGAGENMRLYLARSADTDIAGIVVFLWGTTATYLWGGSSAAESARHLNPNQLLHWSAMQWARERGCTCYDLFGIPDHDVEVLEAEYSLQTGGMWNLYRFKRGFGGTVHRHLGTFDCLLRRG